MSQRNSSEREGHPVFYGRGGAGNANRHPETGPPPPELLGTPTLKSKAYTTGRGGTGNMAINDPDHPEIARESQDVDVPHESLAAERRFPTGRGGAGNIHTLTPEERAEAEEYNKQIRAHGEGKANSKEKDHHLRDLVEKGREKLFGHKDHSES